MQTYKINSKEYMPTSPWSIIYEMQNHLLFLADFPAHDVET
jgi:hypothetical protein